jgi:hypothetical protein
MLDVLTLWGIVFILFAFPAFLWVGRKRKI